MITLPGGCQYEYLTLRRGRDGEVDVLGWSTATSGVLEGCTVKTFINSFNSEEEARAAYPQAGGFTSKWNDPSPSLNHLPGEDDPVSGGMYPDDI